MYGHLKSIWFKLKIHSVAFPTALWQFLTVFRSNFYIFWVSFDPRLKTDRIFQTPTQMLQSMTHQWPVGDCSRCSLSNRQRSASGRKLKNVETLNLTKSERKTPERRCISDVIAEGIRRVNDCLCYAKNLS